MMDEKAVDRGSRGRIPRKDSDSKRMSMPAFWREDSAAHPFLKMTCPTKKSPS